MSLIRGTLNDDNIFSVTGITFFIRQMKGDNHLTDQLAQCRRHIRQRERVSVCVSCVKVIRSIYFLDQCIHFYLANQIHSI